MSQEFFHQQLIIGQLYRIYIPYGSRLIFNGTEYSDKDIFMILTEPQKAGNVDNRYTDQYFSFKALVRDHVVNIMCPARQFINFKPIII